MPLLAVYQHHTFLLLPFIAALWGMALLRTLQVYEVAALVAGVQQGIAGRGRSLREAYVAATVGRPWWQRLYDRVFFS